MGFKIADCTRQDISWRICCSSLPGIVPLAKFTSMLWVIILHEYKSLSHLLPSRCDHMRLQFAVIAGLIQFAFTLAYWSPLTLFCFLNSASLTAILPYRLASQSIPLTVNVDTFFSQHWFSCAVTFGAVSLLSCKLMTLMKMFSALVAFGLPVQLLVLFYPICWCLLTV